MIKKNIEQKKKSNENLVSEKFLRPRESLSCLAKHLNGLYENKINEQQQVLKEIKIVVFENQFQIGCQ